MSLKLQHEISNLLEKNKRMRDGFAYIVPSPDNYPYQWLWDSCFHSIVLSHLDIVKAKEELLSVVSKQFKTGLLPHMIYWDKNHSFGTLRVNPNWGVEGTSTITQPPIIADATLKIFNRDKDKEFVKKIYPHLKAFYNFLLDERDIRGNHLIGLVNPDESGEDNSPRFDIPLKLPVFHTLDENYQRRMHLFEKNKSCNFNGPECMSNFFWVKDVPFNTFMVKGLESLSELSKIANQLEDATYFLSQAKLIAGAMKKYMLEDDIFWSVYQPDQKESITDYKKIRIKTWAIFAPLYAKLYSKKEAEHLIDDDLLDKSEFWLSFPIPTVSKDEPSFNPESFWRGPTWIGTNWIVFQGLLNYGFLDIAKEIYKTSKYLIATEGFREFYHPITGKGMGAKNFTWGTLVLDMEKSLEEYKHRSF